MRMPWLGMVPDIAFEFRELPVGPRELLEDGLCLKVDARRQGRWGGIHEGLSCKESAELYTRFRNM